MNSLKLITTEKAVRTNGGGAILFSVKLFFKIITHPSKVY